MASLDHGIAGAVGTQLSMLILYPLDLLRTIRQVEPDRPISNKNKCFGRSVGTVLDVVSEKGVSGVYQGLIPTLQTVGVSYFAYFFLYNVFKRVLSAYFGVKANVATDLIASSAAGVGNVMLTCPLWVGSTRLKLRASCSTETMASPSVQSLSSANSKPVAHTRSGPHTVPRPDSIRHRPNGVRSLNGTRATSRSTDDLAGIREKFSGFSRTTSRSTENLAHASLESRSSSSSKPARSEEHNVSSSRRALPVVQERTLSASRAGSLSTNNLLSIRCQRERKRSEWRALWSEMTQVVRREGFAALWGGCVSSLILVFNPVIQFCVYDVLKRRMRARGTTMSSMQAFVAGAVAKFVATVTTYPLQVAQSRQRYHMLDEGNTRKSTMTQLMEMFAKDGIGGLYAGFDSKLLQTVLNAAIAFVLYERIFEVIQVVRRRVIPL